ncbi:(deoxy)nucleoside triphosphate pyrophosphohydrolase [Geomobilimonas luticola]|uniref:8-oxo-dGTP diphosphatase n=1 Tax=Geomobilimonas luticola TaxID=1114878 RepID=A0ABS5SI60_9BACT|nr:(deoxy)nucleoside triphosphate pyrophosphohydrolase [Geomobilimonas luticola]MBT0653862.1 (deoxy)nucleoside triphosphate pyrophosphohydrolase [Geomobilimonas luticola]
MHPLLVTAALIEHGGNVLLTRRRADVPYPNLWEFPGGKLEPGEDPRTCIVREIFEELGITVTAGAVFDVIYHRYPERTVLVLVYRCHWTSGEITDLEVAEHRWVRPSDLAGYRLLPADMPLAERISREFGHEDTSRL